MSAVPIVSVWDAHDRVDRIGDVRLTAKWFALLNESGFQQPDGNMDHSQN